MMQKTFLHRILRFIKINILNSKLEKKKESINGVRKKRNQFDLIQPNRHSCLKPVKFNLAEGWNQMRRRRKRGSKWEIWFDFFFSCLHIQLKILEKEDAIFIGNFLHVIPWMSSCIVCFVPHHLQICRRCVVPNLMSINNVKLDENMFL